MKTKDLFESHLEYRKKIGNSEKTINEVSRFLGNPIYRAVGEKKIKDLKITDVASIIEEGKEHGIYGSQRAVCYFRQLMEYAIKRGIKVSFDYRDIKMPKVRDKKVEYLSPEELDDVRKCFDISTLPGLRTRALVEFLLDTGLRIGEAISLNRNQVNFETLEIEVLNIKTKEWGSVYMTDRSAKWLQLYLEKREDDHEALFISGRDRLLSVTSRNYIRTKTKHLNLGKKVGHHIFRRTLGTYLVRNKSVDIKSAQEILRHKSERTTLKYYIGVNKERCKKLHARVMSFV